MIDRPITDEVLRRAHDELWRARQEASGVPDIPVETVQALAAGTYQGADRVELLDRVLAHPVTAKELMFFAEVAAAEPKFPARRSLGPLALAAVLLIGVGIAAVGSWRDWWRPQEVRGGENLLVLIEPAEDQPLIRGDRFVWHAMTDAIEYRLELLTADGDPVLTIQSSDTVAEYSDSLPAGQYPARLRATLRDGTEARGRPATVTIR